VRKAVLVALAVVAAIVVFPVVFSVTVNAVPAVLDNDECSDGEIRVFREFPQYGGRRLEPEYSGGAGCYVAFATKDAPDLVETYYKEQLTARGWKLDPPPPPVEAAEGQTEGGGVDAARGHYGYMASWEWPTRDGTSVVVTVIER
jgi:hypothetical protein